PGTRTGCRARRRAATRDRTAPPAPGGSSPSSGSSRPSPSPRAPAASAASREKALARGLVEEAGDPARELGVHVVVGGREPAGAEPGRRGAGQGLGPTLGRRPRGVARIGQDQERGGGERREAGRGPVLPERAEEQAKPGTGHACLDPAAT